MAYPKNRKHKSPEERFFSMVSKSATGCWMWTGSTSSSGYGVMQNGKRGAGLVRAHRFSYVLHKGEIPESKIIMHSCNNKLCVNPDHLSVGTHSENLKAAWDDKLRKKPNSLIGEINRKLTAVDVKEIRTLHEKTNILYKDLAKMYSVSVSCIFAIVKRRTWVDV